MGLSYYFLMSTVFFTIGSSSGQMTYQFVNDFSVGLLSTASEACYSRGVSLRRQWGVRQIVTIAFPTVMLLN